jgi:Fe-S-cluster containining protein
MGTLQATGDDVKRWRREKRRDILRFAYLLGPPADPVADLWIDQERGTERERCPFVRKVPGQHRYMCRIYDTRPQVCRDYVPWSGEPNDVCEVVAA